MSAKTGAGPDRFLEPWPAQWTASIAAAATASDPGQALRPLLSSLGFDHVTCIALVPAFGGGERVVATWSTASMKWTARYRELAHAAHDPRVTMTAARRSPIVWDAHDVDGDWQVQRFLKDAARHGIRSGFAVSFRDAEHGRAVVAFDSARSPLGDVHCATLLARIGDLMLLAAALHDRVLRPRLAAVGVDVRTGSGLTPRERSVLCMAANGMTSADIGAKLGIAERTVNFHVRNVLQKLQALNRAEAIAKAVARGVVDAAAFAQRSV
jgi:DNA-binding CsgD family transcriptional regulator